MSSDQAITSLSLTDADRKRLDDQRAAIEQYLGDEGSRQKYQTPVGKLGTIRAILRAGIFSAEHTFQLQSLGVVLGDAFVQELQLEWIMVEDEAGRDPALRVPGTEILLYPLTMISKRIERGEQVDVFDLFNGVACQIDDLRQQR